MVFVMISTIFKAQMESLAVIKQQSCTIFLSHKQFLPSFLLRVLLHVNLKSLSKFNSFKYKGASLIAIKYLLSSFKLKKSFKNLLSLGIFWLCVKINEVLIIFCSVRFCDEIKIKKLNFERLHF